MKRPNRTSRPGCSTSVAGGNLISQSRAYYDDLGRTYRQETDGVNPTTGAVENTLQSNNWYDLGSNIIKASKAGSTSFMKTVFDALNRPTVTYAACVPGTAGVPTGDTNDVSSDTVFEQNETFYDGLTRRVTETVSGVTNHCYYSNAWKSLEERHDTQTTPAAQYFWGTRYRDDLVRRDRATSSGGALDETRYVLMDYFSPSAIADHTGSVAERYAFTAFGIRSIFAADFGSRVSSEYDWTFAFQGQFLDCESGWLNYGHRYYSTRLGRWLCKDPIKEKGGFNLYVSMRNDPQNRVDMYGLWPAKCCQKQQMHLSPGDNPSNYTCCGGDLYQIYNVLAPPGSPASVQYPNPNTGSILMGQCCGTPDKGQWLDWSEIGAFCCVLNQKVAKIPNWKAMGLTQDECYGLNPYSGNAASLLASLGAGLGGFFSKTAIGGYITGTATGALTVAGITALFQHECDKLVCDSSAAGI